MKELFRKFVAIIFMIVALSMFWLPIYMDYSGTPFPGVVIRHIIASILLWYGAFIVVTAVAATLLDKRRYAGWALSIGIPVVILGAILTLSNI